MHGLMMDFPLTLPAIFRHAERVFPRREIVTRRADRSLHRYTFADFALRTRRLAGALKGLGIVPGDRVATLCWNHHQHLEAYFGVSMIGAVLHTLNLRLHPDELSFIVNDADDTVVVVDETLLPIWEKIAPGAHVRHVIVVGPTQSTGSCTSYESLLSECEPLYDEPELDERTAAAMCYTTGTTGRPKGVLYSHRSLVLHTFAVSMPSAMGLAETDVVLPVVPMFHANAWGLPYAAVMNGAKLVMPGPHLDPASLVDLFSRERVTFTAGVPTIWMSLLQLLDASPGAYDLSAMRMMFVGGAAVPQALIEAFHKRHGLRLVHAWGMTETTPLGTVSHLPVDLSLAPEEAQYETRARQGRPVAFVEIRARNEHGLVPHDGQTMGELEVRGPWVAAAYYNRGDCADRFTDDGWFRTGDIVTIDERFFVTIQDRVKDLIKSGGEWISSIALESALMGHPAIAEAAVIPFASTKWGERPLAVVVLKPGASVSPEELRAFLAPSFPKFWLPDAFEFIDAIPRTSAGKFQKSALRERFNGF
ncbi:MAG TPA: long-chain fatty acid--CoA ligase, partial [Vicinamibacterales bacterium]|nr:long-chain fatty acid--CoA ligase [Vicinamibacterales bacterium]